MTELGRVEPIHVAAYREVLARQLAPRSVKLDLAAIRRCFDYLVAGGALHHNPAAAVRGPRMPRGEGKTPAFEGDEVRALRASIGTERLIDVRDRALIAVFAYAGTRRQAVHRLQVRHVDRRAATIFVTEKGGKERELPLHPEALADLERWIERAGIGEELEGHLFRAFDRKGALTGRPLDPENIRHMVKRRVRAAGLSGRFTPHSFRATLATELLELGIPLDEVQSLLGHSSADTTRVYDRRRRGVRRAAVAGVRY